MNNKIIIASCKGGCSNTSLTEWVTDTTSLAKVIKSPKIGNKDGTYFVRATGTHRSTDALNKKADVLILDGDSRIDENGEIKSGAPDPAEVTSVLTKLGVPHILYSSHSNGATEAEQTADPLKPIDSGGRFSSDYHKYRVIIPCQYTAEQLPSLLDYLFAELHRKGVMLFPVMENRTWAQAWYLPRVPDKERLELFTFYQHESGSLDVDAIYSDWQIDQQATRKRITEQSQASMLKATKRVESGLDPVKAYVSSYSIEQGFEMYGFKKIGKRWLSPNSGSGVPGVTIIGQKWFSKHGSDAKMGREHEKGGSFGDAFDLFVYFEHDGDYNKAVIAAGDMFKTVSGLTLNEAQQIDYRQKQAEQQQQQQKPGKAQPPPRDQPVFTGDIDISTVPDFPPIGEQSPSKTERPQFNLVSIADVFTKPPDPQGYVWGGRIPFGAVTLLAAHGGTGKSLLALLLAICVAVGREFLGSPTVCLKTIFFSAEDSVDTLRRRVAAICRAEEIDPAVVADNLTLVDATDAAVLFEEVNPKGVKFVAVSENYPILKKLIDDKQIKFAIIDNASDVYAADPVNRQYVTQFIRALLRLLPGDAIAKAVLLLAHVNRNTAKAGKNQTDTEGYADSAAWHNATRSRLFLNAIDDNGGLELKHLKNNFGVKQPPLFIQFRDDGSGFYVPNTLNDDAKAAIKATTVQNNKLAILGLIREFYDRGEWISSEPNSRSNAHALLKHEPAYPFKKDDRDEREGCATLLRECHREKLLIVETYKKAGRDSNRWALTEKAVERLKWPAIVRDELED